MACSVNTVLLRAAVAAVLITDACAFVAQPHHFGVRVQNTNLAMSDDPVSERLHPQLACSFARMLTTIPCHVSCRTTFSIRLLK